MNNCIFTLTKVDKYCKIYIAHVNDANASANVSKQGLIVRCYHYNITMLSATEHLNFTVFRVAGSAGVPMAHRTPHCSRFNYRQM